MTTRSVKKLIRRRRPASLAEYMEEQRRVVARVAELAGVTEMSAVLLVAPIFRATVRHPADR